MFVSRVAQDFESLLPSTTAVQGSAGCVNGQNGTLRGNALGLRHGLFMDLPRTVSRIIPFLGANNVHSQGYQLWMGDDRGELFNPIADTTFEVRYTGGLPHLTVDIFEQNALVYHTASSCMYSTNSIEPSDNPAHVDSYDPRELECAPVPDDIVLSDELITTVSRQGHSKRLAFHQSIGHWWIQGIKVQCPECDACKGERRPHPKVRTAVVKVPLRKLNFDFSGSIRPHSVRGHSIFLLVICDVSKFVVIVPLTFKSQLSEALQRQILRLRSKYSQSALDKVVFEVRSDREPVNVAKDVEKALTLISVSQETAIPHNSEHNATCERAIRSFSDSIRTMLHLTDARLWCYAAEATAVVRNSLPQKYSKLPECNGMAPQQVVDKLNGRHTSRLPINPDARFGCLCYYRVQAPKQLPKLSPHYHRGVYLGLTDECGYPAHRAGTFAMNGGRESWYATITQDIKFRPNVMIRDIDSLRASSKGLYVPYHSFEYPADQRQEEGDRGGAWPTPVVPAVNPAVTRFIVLDDDEEREGVREQSRAKGGAKREEGSRSENFRPDETKQWSEKMRPLAESAKGEVKQWSEKKMRPLEVTAKGGVNWAPPRAPVSETVSGQRDSRSGHADADFKRIDSQNVMEKSDASRKKSPANRKRGRPVGSKDAYPRTRRSKAELNRLALDAFLTSQALGRTVDDSLDEMSLIPEDEKLVEIHSYLSVKQALSNPDTKVREEWQRVIDKEEAQCKLTN